MSGMFRITRSLPGSRHTHTHAFCLVCVCMFEPTMLKNKLPRVRCSGGQTAERLESDKEGIACEIDEPDKSDMKQMKLTV